MYWKRKAPLLLAMVVFLAGCAPAATPTPQVRTEAAAATATAPVATPAQEKPRHGGTLLLNEYADPASMDVHMETSTVMIHPIMPAYNGLVQYDPLDPDKVIGDLAEKWEVSPDGKVYTFTLRSGVKWHDGKPFSSDDVKFSLERILDPKTRSARAEYLKPVDRMEAPDAGTFKLTLKYAFNIVPLLAIGWMQVLPKHVIQAKGDMKKDVVGTGPFRLKEYRQGVLWRMEKNRDYFLQDRPYLDGIVTYIIRDAATRMAAFRTGQVQLTIAGSNALPQSAMEAVVKTNPDTVVYKFDSAGSSEVSFNHKLKPWEDIRIRRAVELSIDRHSAIKVLGGGDGFIGSYFPRWGVPPEELLKRPGWRESKDADRAEAKRLLAEAGHPNGFKTRMLQRAGGEFEKIAQFLQAELRTIGIDSTIDAQDPNITKMMENEGKYEVNGRTSSYYLYDPYEVGKRFLTGAAAIGVSGAPYGFSSPKYEDLFQKQGATLDPTARKQIVKEMDELLLQELPASILMWRSAYILTSPKVRNYRPGLGGYNNFRSQDVWLAQ